jgi:hypothetical protein
MGSFLRDALILAAALNITTATYAGMTMWDFDTTAPAGVAPSGWQNASQAGSPPSYQLEEFQETTALRITAAGNTWNRVKVSTSSTYTSGTYTWRVFIPSPSETGAATAIAAFLYSPQSTGDLSAREVDFEIGYGTAASRAKYAIPAGKLICHMTVQRDDSSNTAFSSAIFQPANPADHITPNNWYTLTIQLTTDPQGGYVHNWYIQRDGGERLTGRLPYTAKYGPANAFPTSHRIYCSVENLSGMWIGDHQPTTDQTAWFDWVSFDDQRTSNGQGTMLTDLESDSSSGAFPYGNDREWTRFGVAYNGIAVDTNATNAVSGDKSLSTTADFSAGTFYGVRYNLAGESVQLRSNSTISYYGRRDGPSNATTRLALVETDGDIWIDNSPHGLTTSYARYSVPLTTQRLSLADGSGGGDLDLNLRAVGFDLLSNGDRSGTPTFRFDDISTMPEIPSSVNGWTGY